MQRLDGQIVQRFVYLRGQRSDDGLQEREMSVLYGGYAGSGDTDFIWNQRL